MKFQLKTTYSVCGSSSNKKLKVNNVIHQVNPDEFEDASLPDQHETPEPLAWLSGVVVSVVVDVRPLPVHRVVRRYLVGHLEANFDVDNLI